MNSFLKWPGGKRWFVRRYINALPKQYNHYYEPFLGSGSMFFELLPNESFLSDINEDLINLFLVMRDMPNSLKDTLIQYNKQHSKDFYYYIRGKKYNTALEKAAQFLYLNRTCYNGMYRVNKKGDFNVPIGTKSDCIYDINKFDTYSNILKKSHIRTTDFEDALKYSVKNDLIFADPPYVSNSKNVGFSNYNDKIFTWQDQLRLHKSLVDARERGSIIVLTNVNCKEIIDLYKESEFYVAKIQRNSTISGSSKGRKNITELMISSFEIDPT